MFWSVKIFTEVLDKLLSRGFRVSSLSTYNFATLYTILFHNLMKKKLINLTETTFHKEVTLYFVCSEEIDLFTSDDQKCLKLFSCQTVCDALIYVLADHSFILSSKKLHRQIVGIPMGSSCCSVFYFAVKEIS